MKRMLTLITVLLTIVTGHVEAQTPNMMEKMLELHRKELAKNEQDYPLMQEDVQKSRIRYSKEAKRVMAICDTEEYRYCVAKKRHQNRPISECGGVNYLQCTEAKRELKSFKTDFHNRAKILIELRNTILKQRETILFYESKIEEYRKDPS